MPTDVSTNTVHAYFEVGSLLCLYIAVRNRNEEEEYECEETE